MIGPSLLSDCTSEHVKKWGHKEHDHFNSVWHKASGHRPCLVCDVLVNSDILTADYGVKQSQFTKPTSEPRASDPEEYNEAFDRVIRE